MGFQAKDHNNHIHIHNLYADDVILFLKALPHDWIGFRDSYRSLIRLLAKALIYLNHSCFSAMQPILISNNMFQHIYKFLNPARTCFYLGIPLPFGRGKGKFFHYLLSRIHKKAKNQRGRQLSHAEKLVMMESKLQSIFSIHVMRCLQLPLNVRKNIPTILANFFWQSDHKNRKTRWVSQCTLCQHKSQEGWPGSKRYGFIKP